MDYISRIIAIAKKHFGRGICGELLVVLQENPQKECLYFFAIRWRRGEGYNTRDAMGSEAAESRGCTMPNFANLRIRRITRTVRFGVCINDFALL
ncbi:hypothetical protein Y032_0053g2381 [Ancylostoma ceylanicum]|uniref:Uncharacterized protein n=1 Tax=Ancylostoma ceylanicum TaxID=53326 RepID=A0A016U8K7_9BILA|nr:hypothetical protein Y032_0053g2381 [Ancylostoma ceylanicum]